MNENEQTTPAEESIVNNTPEQQPDPQPESIVNNKEETKMPEVRATRTEINMDVHSTLQAATNQIIGSATRDTIDLQGIVDAGKEWDFGLREQWVKTLTGMYIKDMYTDRAYKDKRNDVFYEDAARFGAINRIISMEMPDLIENRSWIDVTSGTTTIGSNTVYLPIVKQQLFGATDSWGVSVAYSGNQLDAAFESVSGLLEFDSYVKLMAQNAIEMHKATMNSLNRNNYIGEKLNAGNSSGKVNVINLVEEYQKDHSNSAMTRAQFLSSADAMRYSVKTFKKYMDLLHDMTTLFTMDSTSKGKFVPDDRMVFQVLGEFEGRMDAEVYSTTYHEQFVKLPLYRSVNAWQALTGITSLTFADLSAIDVTTSDGNTVSRNGIVAMMVDKWAIMHTMVQNRVGYQRDDIKNISMYDYQFTDRYMNNLMLPGIVFTVDDYTPSNSKSKK